MRNYHIEKNITPHPVDFNNWSESIALYGCSCTYGHYLDPEHHLHNVIETDRPVNNFAYPGESNWHMWMKVIDHIKEYGMPYKICIGWTSPYRIALYNEGIPNKKEILPIGHWTKENHITGKIGKEWVTQMKVTQEEYSKLIVDSLKLICGEKLIHWTLFHNLKEVKEGPGKAHGRGDLTWIEVDGGLELMYGDGDNSAGIVPLTFLDRGNDGSHPGPLTVKNVMAKLIESRL